jgi:chromosome segregation ATPase
MTLGTLYVAQHIFSCLLLAAGLGAALAALGALWLRGGKSAEMEAEWSKKLGLVSGERDGFASQLKTAEASVGDWKAKFSTIEGEHKSLQAKFADVSAKVPQLETALASWTNKSLTWDAERAKIQTDYRNCAETRMKLEGQLNDWTSRGKAWDAERAAINAEWNGKMLAANDTIAHLRGQVATLEGDHGKLKSTFADVQAKIGPLEGAVAGWVAKSAAWDADRAKLETEAHTASDVRTKLESDLKSSAAQVADLKGRLATMEQEWHARYLALDHDHTAATAKIADLEGRVSSVEQEWHARYLSLDSEHQQLLSSTSIREQQLQAHISDLGQRLHTAEQHLHSAHAESKAAAETHFSALADLQGRLGTMEREWHSRYMDLQHAHTTTMAAHASTVADLQNRVSTTEKEWHARYLTLDQEQSQLLADLRSRLHAVEAHASDLGHRLHQTEERLHAAHLNAKAATEAHERTAADLRYRLSTMEQEWHGRYLALDQEHAQLRAQFTAVQPHAEAAPLAFGAAAGASSSPVTVQAPVQPLPAGDIEDIEGISSVYGGKLRSIGISWIHELLETGKTPEGRAGIVERTGIDHRLVLRWVNHSDLLRVEGVTPDWAELLEASGVDTVKELRHRVPENLQAKMQQANPTPRGRIAPTVPDLETVRHWIELAKGMEPKITY